GAFDPLYRGSRVTRRDLLARVGALERRARRPARASRRLPRLARPRAQLLLDWGGGEDGFAEAVPAGELRELTRAERIQAELEILGIDLSEHVLGFYQDLMTEL